MRRSKRHTPGPALFTQQPALVWGLIAAMFIGNIVLLLINIPLVGLFTRLLLVLMGGLGIAGYLQPSLQRTRCSLM